MLVLSDAAIRMLTETIVNAARSTTDTAGGRAQLGTMNGDALRTAAIMAVSVATGQPVWPESEEIAVAAPTRKGLAVRIVERA